MGKFAVTRPRDAFGVIRGFVYQVDLTIDRWLGLHANDLMELERGEDIDTVVRAVDGNEEASRLLEQVKYRDRSITLRSPEAVEVLANAIEHFDANKEVVLYFQFTTNATAGIERPSPFQNNDSAIKVWEEVRLGRRQSAEAELDLTAIKFLLASRPKPENVPEKSWLLFRSVVDASDNVPLRRLVSAFSWCTRVPNAVSIKETIQTRLVQIGHATSISVAVEQYRRLFMYVLNLLTQSGLKRLSPTDLTPLLALPALDQGQEEGMSKVFGRLELLEQRLDDIIARTDQLELKNKIGEMAQTHGVSAAVTYVAATPTLRPADRPFRFSHRKETVASLGSLLHDHIWLEINGSPGVGKSELARLISESVGGIRAWLDFRGLDGAHACVMLDTAAKSVAGCYPASERLSAYLKFVNGIGGGMGVLVADDLDLPRRQNGELFDLRFYDLVRACQTCNVRLISTSLRPPPNWLLERIPSNSYVIRTAPTFTDGEVREILQNYSAPTAWLRDSIVSTINGATGGHPTLLVAGIRYLQNHNWKITHDEFLKLLRGAFFSDVRRETVQKFLHLIADGETRELLYRANFAITTFSEQDIAALARVDKPIARPIERLQELMDICIQHAPTSGFRVSPLFKVLGTSDVPPPTATGCHRVLGESILTRNSIGVDEVIVAIHHFCAASDHNRAAILLLKGLISLNEHEGKVDGGLLTLFWHDMPLPESIDLGLRMLIRANQICLYGNTGQPIIYALNDLEALASKATEKDSWALLGAGITVQPILAASDVRRANRFLIRSLRAMPAVKAAIGNRLDYDTFYPEQVLWANGMKIASVADLDDWISTVDNLTTQERQNLFNGELADGGCWHIADAVWLAEGRKHDTKQDWNPIFDSLIRLEQVGIKWGQPILEACAIRSRIMVEAEYQRDLQGAIVLATNSLKLARLTGKAAYPIRESVGRQFLYNENNDEARRWFEDSLRDAGNYWQGKKTDTLMYLASISDSSLAIELLSEAASVAAGDSNPSALTHARIYGALALTQWISGHRLESLRSVDMSFDYLLREIDENDKLWRATVAILGHCLAYISQFAVTGKPPDTAADGLPFAEPKIRMLITVNLKLSDWLTTSRLSFLYGMIASMADALGEDEIAERRALQSLDMARDKNELLSVSTMGTRHALGLVVSDRHPEALDLAMQSAAASQALSIVREAGGDLYATDRTSEQIIGSKPSSAWKNVEYEAFVLTVLPIFLRLSTHKIKDVSKSAALAGEVIAAIDVISQNASDHELWKTIRNIFVQTFIEPIAGVDLNELGNELKKQQRHILQGIAYLAATLQNDASPEQALINHLYVIAELKLKMPASAYRRLMIPFLEAYWSRVFSAESFRFTPPVLYRDLFASAMAEPIDRRAQAILRLGFQGLRVHIPEKYRDWLNLSG